MFAGQDIRLIDVAADHRPHGAFDCLHGEAGGREFAERMQRAVGENYGFAGPAFVKSLMQNVHWRERLNRFINSYCDAWSRNADLPPDGQIKRVMVRFAIAALAGELATKFGLTGWTRGAARAAAFELFVDWHDAHDGVRRTVIDEAVARTRGYVSENLDRFALLGVSSAEPLDGWRDNDWVYTTHECWCRIHENEDPIEMARLHKTSGILKTQQSNGLQFKMGRSVPGRPNVYAIRAEALKEV